MGLFDSIRGFFGGGKPAPITQPSGTDGVAAPGGYLFRGETNAKLVGLPLWLTISDAITNSIVVAAAARYFLNLIAGTEWEVEPADDPNGERAADLVRDGLLEADMVKPWSAVVRKAALYKFYGFSMHEWTVRKRDDGTIVFADVAHRPQYTVLWWDKVDEKAPLLGVVQQSRWGHRYYLPRNRLLYCVDDTLTDSPDGIGLIRHVIPRLERLNRYEQLEGIGFETDLRGIPVGRAPLAKLRQVAGPDGKGYGEGWVKDQIAGIKDFCENHVRTSDLSLVIDSTPYHDKEGHPSAVPQWAVDLIKGDNGPLEEIAAAINRVNLEIARVIGAEFMMMGGTSTGSRAMHEDKTDQFGNLIQSTLGELAGFARNDLARTLVALNGMDADKATPKLLPGSVATESVVSVAQALQYLAQAGAPLRPDDPAVDQIRARLHLAAQPALTPDLAGPLPPRPSKKPPPAKSSAEPTADDAEHGSTTDDDSVDVDVDDLGGLGGDSP